MKTVTIRRSIRCSKTALRAAFFDGTVFVLTGADRVVRDGPRFRLIFGGRGEISGELLDIREGASLRLAWRVRGFGRPDEATTVHVSIAEARDASVVHLRHSGIPSHESQAAKRRAWRSILADLDQQLGAGTRAIAEG